MVWWVKADYITRQHLMTYLHIYGAYTCSEWMVIIFPGITGQFLNGHGHKWHICASHISLFLLDIDHWWISNKSISTPPSSTISFPSSSMSYFHHIFDTPPFVPVPLVSPFIPTFPVSLLSVSMSPWSSCLLCIVFLPHSCLSLFHASTFVPSPWPSQADPAA